MVSGSFQSLRFRLIQAKTHGLVAARRRPAVRQFGPGALGNGEGRRATFDFPPVDKDRAWACIAAMREIAKKHDTGVAAVALAYILAKPFVTTVITGAKRLAQLEENLAAVKLRLDADDLQKLDEVSSLTPEYPTWMLSRQATDRRPSDFIPKD